MGSPDYVRSMDLIDRAARDLGIIRGNRDQLQQRAGSLDLLVQLMNGGVEIDPRDVLDRDARVLGRAKLLDSVGALIDPARDRVAAASPSAARLSDGVAFYDARLIRALTAADVVDVGDRAGRLLGKIYGDLAVLKQRAVTFELLTQLAHAGVELDPRQIRTLTAADVVDVSDRAARLLGQVMGSQSQALSQRAATFDLLVQLRHAGVEVDARTRSWTLSSGTDNVAAAQGSPNTHANRWPVGVSDGVGFIDPRDVSDRDARLLGRVKLLDVGGVVVDPAAAKATKASVTLLASAARTATGDSADADVSDVYAAIFFLEVTAREGTAPTLTVYIRSKDPTSGSMVRVGQFTAQDSSTTVPFLEPLRIVGALGDTIDVEFVIGGTGPSWTFSMGMVKER